MASKEKQEADLFGQELVNQVLAPLGWTASIPSWLWWKDELSVALITFGTDDGGWFILRKRINRIGRFKSQKFQLADPDILEKIRTWAEQVE